MDFSKYKVVATDIAKQESLDMVKRLVKEVLLPAGKEYVDASSTKVDDLVWPMLEKAFSEALDKV